MIVLASASPRRGELLASAGVDFVVEPAGIDERLEAPLPPPEAAEALARRKAREVARRRSGQAAWVVGADTLVALQDARLPSGWLVLGKPANAGEARAMLERLSGSRHAVVTGVCVVRASDGAERGGAETTWVTMRRIEPREVEAYVESGEWFDKAGGYAIQETADRFVTGIEGGGFDNVVGIPVGLVLELLAELGAPGITARLARRSPRS